MLVYTIHEEEEILVNHRTVGLPWKTEAEEEAENHV
jgi:hypothetical protein